WPRSRRWRPPITRSIMLITAATRPSTTSTTATRSTPRRPPRQSLRLERLFAARGSARCVDDVALVAGALAGRQECFEALVERHQRAVHALAYRWLGDHAAADEGVPATLLHAHTPLADSGAARVFRGWLCGIAQNQARNASRARRRERTVSLDEVPEAALPQ